MDRENLSKPSSKAYPFKLDLKADVQKLGTKILKRIFEDAVIGIPSDAAVDDDSDLSDDHEESFQEKLRKGIGSDWERAEKKKILPSLQSNDIQKYFRSYEQDQPKGPLLEKLLLALCSIQPTSTQSERNFSLNASFLTKLRTRLTSEHVDMLSFLKSHFMSIRHAP